MPRTLARFALLLLVLGAPLAASAQTAKELHDRGVQALHEGRYAEAVQSLDASYRKEQVPSALYNLGLAYKGMGHPDKALEAFEGYVRFADPKKDKKTIDAVRGEIARLKSAYARFALKLTPADATIEIDGTRATPSKNELWVQTGKHKITVRAPNYETYEQELDVVAGRFDLEVRLREPSGPPDQRAAALVDAGMALQAAGSLQAALDKYKEAQSIFPTPRATAQMGLTEEAMGDLGAAERHLIEAQAARKDPWIKENRKRLRAALNRLKAQLSTLDIKGTPDGAEVTVNDRPAGLLPNIPGVRVGGGAITIRAKKEGYTDYEETIELPPRAKRMVRVDMTVAPPKPPPVVVAPPPPQPQPAPVPALKPEPAAPPPAELPPPEPVAAPKPTQSDIESFSDARGDLEGEPGKVKSATGFEMQINFGYQPWLSSQKLADSSGMPVGQIVLGARLIWPFSFGLLLSAGGGGSTDALEGFLGLNPGVYVRGHIQQQQKQFAFDVWAGSGIQPVAAQVAFFKAEELDLSMVDPAALDPRLQQAAALGASGVEVVRSVQSINVPIDLGATFYVTESIGINLALALTFWLPQQSCDHGAGNDRICRTDGLRDQTSLFIGGGLALLP